MCKEKRFPVFGNCCPFFEAIAGWSNQVVEPGETMERKGLEPKESEWNFDPDRRMKNSYTPRPMPEPSSGAVRIVSPL